MTSNPAFVCVLHFEETCEKDVKYYDNEIIEFPSVLLKLEDKEYKVISTFQKYCKPCRFT